MGHRWEYDFDAADLVQRDATTGNETGRAPLGLPVHGSRLNLLVCFRIWICM
jgi:hypothetical protein